jgi:hypothetical protein
VPVQQDGGYLAPLFLRRGFRVGLVRTLVPIACIVRIPLFAMQIGMDPSRLLPRIIVLGDVMSTIEISLGIPP